MNDRRGFTLVELIIVALVGSVMVLAAYQVLITNQRTYAVQNSKVQAQQSTRAAMEVLFAELRELSAAGGDVVDFDAQSLSVRAMRTVGVVCDNMPASFGGTPQLLVREVSRPFAADDSIFVFADGDEYRSSDDTWIEARVTAVQDNQLCAGTYDAQLLSFAGQSATFMADTVREGAPLRSHIRFKYALGEFNGDMYLGRAEAGGDWLPLVGPLAGVDGRPGLEFGYLDADGNDAGTSSEISRIVVTVRSFADVRDRGGNLVVDSLTTSIFTRN